MKWKGVFALEQRGRPNGRLYVVYLRLGAKHASPLREYSECFPDVRNCALGTLGQVFRNRDELVRNANQHAFPPEIDDALLFPTAQRSADRVERRAGHFGNVLARKWQVDQHTLPTESSGASRIAWVAGRRTASPRI